GHVRPSWLNSAIIRNPPVLPTLVGQRVPRVKIRQPQSWQTNKCNYQTVNRLPRLIARLWHSFADKSRRIKTVNVVHSVSKQSRVHASSATLCGVVLKLVPVRSRRVGFVEIFVAQRLGPQSLLV